MSLTILHAPTAAAVSAAAANQTAKLEALRSPFVTAGAVSVRALSSGGTNRGTGTYPGFDLLTTTPRKLALQGPPAAYSHFTDVTPARFVFAAGGVDIFELTSGVTFPGAWASGMRVNLSDPGAAGGATRLEVTADSSLPVNGLPAWVPAPGATANISLNDYTDTNYASSWFQSAATNQSPWRNWSQAVYCSGYSTYGAMFYWGGGHNGGNDADGYLFDFTTRQWSRVGPGNPATNYVNDTNTGNPGECLMDATWCDYDHAGSKIVPAVHTYGFPNYIPPGYSGVGSKGAWILPHVPFGPLYNAAGVQIAGQSQPHIIDLASGASSRFAVAPLSPASTFPGFAGSIMDPIRERLWWAPAQETNVCMLDLTASHPRTIQTQTLAAAFAPSAYYPVYVYVDAADRFIEFACDYSTTVVRAVVYNTTTGTIQQDGRPTNFASATGAPALDPGFGVDWCPDTGKFYFYDGYGHTTVHTLTPSNPADLMASTWTWGTETFSNPAWQPGFTNTGGGFRAFGHWRYIRTLKCFCWTDANTSAVCLDGLTHDWPMQLWRPPGT